jgi:hypothetical protein
VLSPKEAEAIAEAGAAAAAAAKIGGKHVVVTGHPVAEFCVRYSLPPGAPDSEASSGSTAGNGTGGSLSAMLAPHREVAFESPHGCVLFWHVASQSWVFGFGHKQQALAEEELLKCATLSLSAGDTSTAQTGGVALHGTQVWDHKGTAVEITLTAFEDEKAAQESVAARKHTTSSFDKRFSANGPGFQASPSDETMSAALSCIPEHKALLEST